MRNNEELEHFHELKDKWRLAQRTGDFAHVTTPELEEIIKYFKKAEEGLVFFPECESTIFWCRFQMHVLEGYVRERKRKD